MIKVSGLENYLNQVSAWVVIQSMRENSERELNLLSFFQTKRQSHSAFGSCSVFSSQLLSNFISSSELVVDQLKMFWS